MTYLTTVLLLLVLSCLVHSQLVQICDADTFVGSNPTVPPLPDLPSQFSSTVEANLIQRSQTFVIKEHYDQPGDRGRLEFVYNGTRETGIYDYTLGEVFVIPDPRGGDCRVFPIAPNSPFLAMTFGIEQRNGSIHIGSPAAFLERLQANASTVYLGEDTVRGVPVLHWQSCVSLPNNSYLVDYYFSHSNWTYGYQSDNVSMVPIQFNLNASFVNSRRGTVDNANHVYSFVDFLSGPSSVPDDVFVVPSGLACKGRIPGQPLPSLPNTFSGRIEFYTTFHGNPVLVTFQEFYDFRHNLFRLDYYDRTGPTSVIHDFSQGLQYRIDQMTEKCSVSLLSNISRQIDFNPDSDSPQIASPNQLSLLQTTYNYSYEGVSTVRGVDVDSWVSVREFESFDENVNITNAVIEVFFTRPGLAVVNEHSASTVPVILRFSLRGNFTIRNMTDGTVTTKPMNYQFDYFDMSTSEPPYDAYDISACFEHDDIVSMVFVVPGHLVDLAMFRANFRAAISNYTGVSPLQVSNINIHLENDSYVFVHVHISNLSSLATTPQEDRVSANYARDLLVNGTKDPVRPFSVLLSPNVTVNPTIHSHGPGPALPGNNSCPTLPPPTAPPTISCNSTDDNDLQKQLALKDREIIGIAIGLLFGGMLLGALIMFVVVCVCRCACKGGKGSYNVGRNVQYKKHEDDIAFNN